MVEIFSRKRAPSPKRRILRSRGRETCCNDKSKYGHPLSPTASMSSSVRPEG